MADPLLVVEGAVKEYGQAVVTRALDGVDLRIEKGEFAALIGPSGSGKSTLLNIIGLLDRPTRGRVVVGGKDTTGLDEASLTRLRARTLGFVFQFHHLLPMFTALENVMLPAWGDEGFPSSIMKERAAELLAAVGLAERMNFKASALSGGQQQRVAIARALSRRPPLVLADEPTGNLDSESSAEVFALMRRFNREMGTTFLIVTHDPRIAERCDRVIEIVDGRIASDRA
ncbi:ABC transporter ATP-binding protein [Sorangium sp. So ce513]|uniref:ABC transporter ATP-binding protein n=1 Tax=Sorangium sp. So ce513 TaxID=3133315 RepID=UPI003F625766